MFGWLKARRRKRILAEPFPRPWQELLHDSVWQYRELSVVQRDRLHQCIKVIVGETVWEGCDGLQINDTIRITIAGQASLMLLGTRDYYFDDLQSILVFPQPFRREATHGYIVSSESRAGEAWQRGPIVLSWEDVRRTLHHRNDYNVVIHEFAHHVDGLDGEMGGNPRFEYPVDQRAWQETLDREFADLCRAADAGHWTGLRHYGAKNKAEFFAVASESFFETPNRLQSTHGQLFELLRRFYRVDPSGWCA